MKRKLKADVMLSLLAFLFHSQCYGFFYWVAYVYVIKCRWFEESWCFGSGKLNVEHTQMGVKRQQFTVLD